MCLKCFIEIIEKKKKKLLCHFTFLSLSLSLYIYIYIYIVDIFYSHLIKEMRILIFEENTEKSDE
jgi:hypothetical protein